MCLSTCVRASHCKCKKGKKATNLIMSRETSHKPKSHLSVPSTPTEKKFKAKAYISCASDKHQPNGNPRHGKSGNLRWMTSKWRLPVMASLMHEVDQVTSLCGVDGDEVMLGDSGALPTFAAHWLTLTLEITDKDHHSCSITCVIALSL